MAARSGGTMAEDFISRLHNYIIAKCKKTNMQLCKRVVSREFISTTKYKKQKKVKCFFAFCLRPTTKRLQKGFCNRFCRSRRQNAKKQKCRNAPKLAPKRDAKLDAARRNRDVIGPACHVDHVITRRSGRNSANCRSGR